MSEVDRTPGPHDPIQEARSWLLDRGVQPPPPPASDEGPSDSDRPYGGGRGVPSSQPDAPTRPNSSAEVEAQAVVLRKLTAAARTRQELRQALDARDIPADVGERVLDRLESVGLVDDGTFAQNWVDSRHGRRHLSRSALARELDARGVAREHIDAALADVDSDSELEAARALAEKRVRPLWGLPDDVRRRRLTAALVRRGFCHGLCARVVSEVLSSKD